MTTADLDVIIPVRNAGRLLKPAIDSVFEDSLSVRVIVVDDHSTDGAVDRLPADPRVVRVPSRGTGIPAALNTGIAAGTAPLVARQDADDVSLPGRLAAEVEFLADNPSIGLVTTFFEVIVRDQVIMTMRPAPIGLLRSNPFSAGSSIVRRLVLEEIGGYREVFPVSSDYDLWLRCAAVTGVSVLPVIGYRYRLTADMSTIRRATEQAAAAELARASARARLRGEADPAEDPEQVARHFAGCRKDDPDVAAWWAREFAALGSRSEALSCAVRARRVRSVLAALGRRPAPQAVWA